MTSAASSEKQGTEGRSPPTHSVSYQTEHSTWMLSRMVSAISHGVGTLVTIHIPPPQESNTRLHNTDNCQGSLRLLLGVTLPTTVERNRSCELFEPLCNKGKRGGSTSACEHFQKQLGKRTFCSSHTFLTRELWPFPRME